MKKSLRNFAYLTGLSALGYVDFQYRREKEQALIKFRNATKRIPLTTRNVEYVTTGTGKPILFAHGGIGGYEQGPLLHDMFKLDDFLQMLVLSPNSKQPKRC